MDEKTDMEPIEDDIFENENGETAGLKTRYWLSAIVIATLGLIYYLIR